jgi:hypothetical protein
LCVDDDTVHKLDALCFGNLDGGGGTAEHVAALLTAAGAPVSGSKAVRLSLDEAFFMAYALEMLTVFRPDPAQGGAAVRLDATVSGGGRSGESRPLALVLSPSGAGGRLPADTHPALLPPSLERRPCGRRCALRGPTS